MPSPVITFFLACVLLWSGFSTIEPPRLFALLPTQDAHASALLDASADALAGSVQDHHLDDQPPQAQSDASAETAGLLQPAVRPHRWPWRMALPHPFRQAAWCQPCLAGPLRPPCATCLTA